MEWYEKWFGEEYKLVYPHRNEEEAFKQVEFLKSHIDIPEGARILDLCCGCGRHSVELKRQGYDVVGVDLSDELLKMACNRAEECELIMQFIKCDMREIPYENEFDLVVNFFTSFGYFDTDEENIKVLFSISKALKTGGKFLVDYMNPDLVAKNLVPRDEKDISENIHVIQERWIDKQNKRVNKRLIMIKDGEKSQFNESVRMYSYHEMENMISQAGLTLCHVYGDFNGSEYNQDSKRMILIGNKS